MKKIYWIFLAVFVLIVLIFLFFKDFIFSNILLVFTGLYLVQFLTGLTVISLTGKSAKSIGLWAYVMVALMVFVILFLRLLPS